MSAQKFSANLAVLGALYNISESGAKRLSSSGIDLENPSAVKAFLQNHAHQETKTAAEKSDILKALEMHTGERSKAMIESGFYHAAIASQYGCRKEDVAELIKTGVDLRDRRASALPWRPKEHNPSRNRHRSQRLGRRSLRRPGRRSGLAWRQKRHRARQLRPPRLLQNRPSLSCP